MASLSSSRTGRTGKPPSPRKGSPSPKLEEEEFKHRYAQQFLDPAFNALRGEIDRIAAVAWEAYSASRKSPLTRKAGPEFADPEYDLSTEWLAARDAVLRAQARYQDKAAAPRILLINCSSRSEHTCSGEMSKSYRLSAMTAAPLCHWPCSSYPNHSLGQTQDWMNEIYPLWVVAHGVMIITPVNWYQVSSPLKLMMDRLVCADGGNPDPTLTQGKDAAKAKNVELGGWDYPRHLAGRIFSVVVHGDVEGAENVRRSVSDWLRFMKLTPAGSHAELDRYIGYWKPYATSHEELDADEAIQEEVRNAARTLAEAVMEQRAGRRSAAGAMLEEPRQK